VLDLYAGRFEGRLLHHGDVVICADEKPSIQARARIHETVAPACSHGQLVEPTYERRGALTYLAAWDVRRGRVFGRSEPKGGIASFDRLVWQVTDQGALRLRTARLLDRRQRLEARRTIETGLTVGTTKSSTKRSLPRRSCVEAPATRSR